jgi:hypothetical protein
MIDTGVQAILRPFLSNFLRALMLVLLVEGIYKLRR